MVLAEIQKRKLKVEFESHDFDGNGILSQSDFERVADQLAKIKGAKPGSSDYEELKSDYLRYWNELQKVADSSGNGEVSLEEWYTYLDGLINNQNEFEQYIISSANKIEALIDADADGKISLENYKEAITSFNLGKGEAEVAFKKLDTDNDGFLSRDELINHVRDFYLSKDENTPGNWIFGRL